MITREQEKPAKNVLDCVAAKELNDVHLAQMLSCLKLSGISLEFLFNFNVRHFKTGVRRVVL
ncbi:MAG: GxxExxY protein [Spirochaetaceae bacterium]|jgi:hypothetical protein|nr:GxxExxY protein [Spirochaetaceae bacterium]